MNVHIAQGFVPTGSPMTAEFSPIKTQQSLSDETFPMAPDLPSALAQKSFVERSMYKRELCKNWQEVGFCRYGGKCQYAHGIDELSENN